MGNGNRPTPEFRREAVRLALTSGRTRREIAEDLGDLLPFESAVVSSLCSVFGPLLTVGDAPTE